MKKFIFLFFLFSMFCFSEVYYVDVNNPKADDRNPGSESLPWKTIGKAAEVLKPGDKVIIKEGVYREEIKPKNSGEKGKPIEFIGEGKVIIKGSIELGNWKKITENIYVNEWDFPEDRFKGYRDCFRYRSEQVFVDGKILFHYPDYEMLLNHERDAEKIKRNFEGKEKEFFLKPTGRYTLEEIIWLITNDRFYADGGFFIDYKNKKIFIKYNGNLEKAKVEVSIAKCLFDARDKEYINLKNLTFMHCATPHFQQGAVILAKNGIAENVEVYYSSGRGITLNGAEKLINCKSNFNGCLGFGGWAKEVKNCETNWNNYKGGGWLTGESGGWKAVYARGMVIDGHIAIGNNGSGIWLDIDNRDCLIKNCFVYLNNESGIFIEISGNIKIFNNIVVKNGLLNPIWAAAGILIAESNNIECYNNVIYQNKEGIAIREQGPRVWYSSEFKEVLSYHCHDINIHHNIIAENKDWQMAFWYDNPSFGPHPSFGSIEKSPDYIKPRLHPDEMRITVDNNIYWSKEISNFIIFGPSWRNKHKVYKDLEQWKKESKYDKNSIFLKVDFKNPSNFNFEVLNPVFLDGEIVGIKNFSEIRIPSNELFQNEKKE